MSTLAFNSYAAEYDNHFTRSPIGILQRKRVFRFLLPLLDPKKNVLEINCGTGEDALSMAPLVNSVLATDISTGMIEAANLKKEKSKLSNVTFKAADIREIPEHLRSPFDLLFSDFGGLNCLSPEELKQFSQSISSFISPGGKLVLVIMGKKCIWENFFFLKQKDKRYKRRNTTKGIETKINDSTFLTYYYAPSEISTLFSGNFSTSLIKPIGLFIPPSYLNPYFANKKWALGLLNFFEKLSGGFSFTANYADHYLIILEKNQSSVN